MGGHSAVSPRATKRLRGCGRPGAGGAGGARGGEEGAARGRRGCGAPRTETSRTWGRRTWGRRADGDRRRTAVPPPPHGRPVHPRPPAVTARPRRSGRGRPREGRTVRGRGRPSGSPSAAPTPMRRGAAALRSAGAGRAPRAANKPRSVPLKGVLKGLRRLTFPAPPARNASPRGRGGGPRGERCQKPRDGAAALRTASGCGPSRSSALIGLLVGRGERWPRGRPGGRQRSAGTRRTAARGASRSGSRWKLRYERRVESQTAAWPGAKRCTATVSSNPLLCAGSPTSSPGCPEPHPAWP